ncbi:MAG: tryptophan synthase subunit alpha [Acidobacteriota bacterium]
MSRIAAAFTRSRREGRAAFIAYLTAGDPSSGATIALAKALERAGADILELGVPFSDPIADGPVLQRAAARALEAGTTLATVFAMARRIREETSLALILFSYFNPILRFGVEAAAREAHHAGFDGALMTDVPPEEARAVLPQLKRAKLDTILLVSPTSPASRMQEAARLSSGFLYVVSRPGTTGAQARLPQDLAQTVRRARKAAGSLPLAVGFGIATRERAVEVLARALVAGCLKGDPAAK